MRSIAIAALLIAASCGGEAERPAARDSFPVSSAPVPGGDSASDAQPRAQSPSGIPFDPAALTKGTRVGTVAADMLTLSKAADSSWIGQARFTGELTLSGRAVPHVDANVREVCFEPDAASAALLPRWIGDTRRAWFCFANQPEAQQSLAALDQVRPATVVIDRFTINKGSAQENSADLVRVVSRGDLVRP